MAWVPNSRGARPLTRPAFGTPESLAKLGDQRAARHRRHDGRGEAPAELLRDLEGDRLGALAVIAAQVHVDDAPLEPVGGLTTEAIHVVVGAADPDHAHAIHRGGDDLGRLEIVRDEDPRREPGTSGMSRGGVGQISGGGAGDGVESERVSRVDGAGDHPVLERERRMGYAVVLEPGASDAQPPRQGRGLDQRSHPGVERESRIYPTQWQELAVAPERVIPAGDGRAVWDRALRGVDRLERAQALVADGHWGQDRIARHTPQCSRGEPGGPHPLDRGRRCGAGERLTVGAAGIGIILPPATPEVWWPGPKGSARCQKDTRDARPFSNCLTWLQYAANHHGSSCGATVQPLHATRKWKEQNTLPVLNAAPNAVTAHRGDRFAFSSAPPRGITPLSAGRGRRDRRSRVGSSIRPALHRVLARVGQRRGRCPRGQHIIYHQHPAAWVPGSLYALRVSRFRIPSRTLRLRAPRQLAGLPDRHEAGPEARCHSAA